MNNQPDDITEYHVKVDDTSPNGLTPILQPIHWPTTQESVEAEYDELDRIDIDNFIDAIAGVALSIATRETAPSEDQERDD